ncbi:ankyrin [Piromyces finnis]|uniref:Ankyrin n=1 Tax=Piromyces finnis TaxID=1754191 RepID=A0A1Y1UYI1_9FUNG|nr:ankyrin [Piromyces finnis]|eukprot:ORX42343.1 ankyrin [Piromyces finnis]
MEFQEFQRVFFTDLKAKNKELLLKIDSKKELIKENLDEKANQETIEGFVERINEIILQSKKKFSLIEKVLKKEVFTSVYTAWKNSKVLIEACKNENNSAIRWLLTTEINPSVQDKEGRTALMYSVKNPRLLSVVKLLCFRSGTNLNMVDKNGENALFYALKNKDALRELLRNNININQLNRHQESPLLYCCKNDIFEPIKYLTNRRDLDVNLVDKEEKTPAMYLAEKAKNSELRLLEMRQCNYDYVNSKQESVLSLVINKMYNPRERGPSEWYSDYLHIIISLVHFNCNFNVPVDEHGNTAIMVFMQIPDLYTLHYILKKCDTIDFSIQNKYGESAATLCKKYVHKFDAIKIFNENPTLVSFENKKIRSEGSGITKTCLDTKKMGSEVSEVDLTEEDTETSVNHYESFKMTKSMEKVAEKVYYECDKYYDPKNELYKTYHVDEMSYWAFV